MVSDIIRKQVADIQEYGFKRLRELSILVLLITVTFFSDYWSLSLWVWVPYVSGLLHPGLIELKYDAVILVLSFVFLIGIVSYFWWLRNQPQFHVLFIECKEEQKQIDTCGWFRKNHFIMLVLLPISIAVGLAITETIYWLFSEMIVLYTSIQSLQPATHFFTQTGPFSVGTGSLPFIPLIVVACLSALLYFVYLVKPEQVERSLTWFLFIPIILSACMVSHMIYHNVFEWYSGVLNGNPPPPGSAEFIAYALFPSAHVIFLASLIILFYLAYRINVGYGNLSTCALGEHSQGVIETGVWTLPKRVRANDTHSSSFDVTFSDNFIARASSGNYPYKSSDYLEAEIQAVGLDVRAEERLRISETSPLPTTTWVYSFTKSGINTINLKINVVKPPHNLRDVIFMHEHNVKVDSFLSVSLVPVLTLIVPILVVVVQALLRVKP